MKTYSEIIRVNELLLAFINHLNGLEHKFPNPTLYYLDECRSIMRIIIKNAEAIIVLADNDTSYSHAASNICRNVFEGAIRLVWLLHPESETEREIRWLGMVKNAKASLETIEKEAAELGIESNMLNAEQIIAMEEVVNKVSSHISARNKKVRFINGIPNFNQMTKESGYDFMYTMYRNLSGHVHLSHHSNRNYSADYGLNEGGILREWWSIYSILLFSLYASSTRYFEIHYEEHETGLTENHMQAMGKEIDKILAFAKSLIN